MLPSPLISEHAKIVILNLKIAMFYPRSMCSGN